MQQILFFLIRNKNFLLFCFLFLLSLTLTIQSHSFHKNKFINSANFFSGGIYSIKSNVTDYFNLKKENKILLEENARIKKRLESIKLLDLTTEIDTTTLPSKYHFVSAKIINNTYSKSKNILTLNKGVKKNIKIDMGVITSKGVVGIVKNTSANYSTVQSILNTNSQINTKLKKSNHFGSLIWNTKNPHIVQLIDIPRLAPLIIGDTVVTGGRSTIFPEGLLIGIIKDFSLNENNNSFTLNIQLFNDMTNLEHVYIIENFDANEINMLEKEVENAE